MEHAFAYFGLAVPNTLVSQGGLGMSVEAPT